MCDTPPLKINRSHTPLNKCREHVDVSYMKCFECVACWLLEGIDTEVGSMRTMRGDPVEWRIVGRGK